MRYQLKDKESNQLDACVLSLVSRLL